MEVVNLFQAINDQSSALSVSRCLPRCGIRWGDSKSGGTWYTNDVYCVVHIIALHLSLYCTYCIVLSSPGRSGSCCACVRVDLVDKQGHELEARNYQARPSQVLPGLPAAGIPYPE